MPDLRSRQPTRRRATWLPIATATLSAILAVQLIERDGRYVAPIAIAAALLLVLGGLGRWRTRKLLMSGDVQRLIGTWEGLIDQVPHPETMAPLLRATAYACYGWIEAARRALGRAVRGPAWEAAVEQRLFIETLLDTFEGDRQAAMHKADALAALPVPVAGLLAHRRVVLLRRGLGAVARAFAHASLPGDAKLLAKAAGASPLVHWVMRYAAAIVAVDRGRPDDVPALLSGAPEWPKESAFQDYHHELLERAAAS
jgi:hypothetical protein